MHGIIGHDESGAYSAIHADYTILATGGIGGIFEHSTNYKRLPGAAIAIALKHGIKLQRMSRTAAYTRSIAYLLKGSKAKLHSAAWLCCFASGPAIRYSFLLLSAKVL